MLVGNDEGVLVQGITGKQGSFWSQRMADCGTRIVAGASPGKGGREVAGVPVYDSVEEATAEQQVDVSVLFVPPLAARRAALDSIRAGVPKLVILTEHIPYHDVMKVLGEARDHDAQVLGPNTAGLVVPGKASVGIMPGFAANIFQPGRVGVISRSGSLGTLMALNLVASGYGQSAFIGIGGDPILGTTTTDALRELDSEPDTDAVVVVGEIGGTMEEEAAEYIATMNKPVVAFIAGRSAPPGRRMGHAGAIITRDKGSGESKVSALKAAGAAVIDVPGQVADALREAGIEPMSAPATPTAARPMTPT